MWQYEQRKHWPTGNSSGKTTGSPSNVGSRQRCKKDEFKTNTTQLHCLASVFPRWKMWAWTQLSRLTFLSLLVGILWTLWLLSLQRWPVLNLSFPVSGDLFVYKLSDLTSRMHLPKLGADYKRSLRLWNSRKWVGNRLSAWGKTLVHRASFWWLKGSHPRVSLVMLVISHGVRNTCLDLSCFYRYVGRSN